MIDFNLFLLTFLLKGRKRLKIETPQGTFFFMIVMKFGAIFVNPQQKLENVFQLELVPSLCHSCRKNLRVSGL
jgi:hypothetical protein